MRKIFTAFLFVFAWALTSEAQFADLGAGKHKDKIFWLNWNAGFIANGTTKTFVLPDSVELTATFSNVTPSTIEASDLKTWASAMLERLYAFSNPIAKPALLAAGQTGSVQYTLSLSASYKGQPMPFTMVAAEAESTTADEPVVATTNGSAWEMFEYFSNRIPDPNSVLNCGSQTITLVDNYQGVNPPRGSVPLFITKSVTGNMAIQANYNRTVFGGSALGFGVLVGADRGDLPASYGLAINQQAYRVVNGCQYQNPQMQLVADTTAFVGTLPGDVDSLVVADDNSLGMDEDALSQQSIPIDSANGTATISFFATNQSGRQAFLSAFVDWNRNNQFDVDERKVMVVPNGFRQAVQFVYNQLPQTLLYDPAFPYAVRIRIGSDSLAFGMHSFGETEDYRFPLTRQCPSFVLAMPDYQICKGDSVQLTSAGTAATTYEWIAGVNSLNQTTVSAPVAYPLATTTYVVRLRTQNGCVGFDTTVVTVNPLPAVAATVADDTVCVNSPAMLTATGTGSFSWQPVSAIQGTNLGAAITGLPQMATWYKVKTIDQMGCQNSDSVLVHVINPLGPTAAGWDTLVCPGDTVVLKAPMAQQIAWLCNGQIVGNQDSFVTAPLTTIRYVALISNPACNRLDSIRFDIRIKPSTLDLRKLGNVTCNSPTTQLLAVGGRNYQWRADSTIQSLSGSQAVVYPGRTRTYYVSAMQSNGCRGTDSVTVYMDSLLTDQMFLMPTAFTPNRDGLNDCFGLKHWGQVRRLDFAVYNRLGERIFWTEKVGDCWNGVYKNQPQAAGAYPYMIKASTVCGEIVRKGLVVLIR